MSNIFNPEFKKNDKDKLIKKSLYYAIILSGISYAVLISQEKNITDRLLNIEVLNLHNKKLNIDDFSFQLNPNETIHKIFIIRNISPFNIKLNIYKTNNNITINHNYNNVTIYKSTGFYLLIDMYNKTNETQTMELIINGEKC